MLRAGVPIPFSNTAPLMTKLKLEVPPTTYF